MKLDEIRYPKLNLFETGRRQLQGSVLVAAVADVVVVVVVVVVHDLFFFVGNAPPRNTETLNGNTRRGRRVGGGAVKDD